MRIRARATIGPRPILLRAPGDASGDAHRMLVERSDPPHAPGRGDPALLPPPLDLPIPPILRSPEAIDASLVLPADARPAPLPRARRRRSGAAGNASASR